MPYPKSRDSEDRPSGLIILSGQKTSGAEHNVWLNRAMGIVHKIPSAFGEFWQKMHPDFAERDLGIMLESGVRVVPTRVHRDAEVICAGNARRRVSYVLEQPLYESSHPVAYTDIFHNQKYRRHLLDIMRTGREIREKYNLGLDLLGGRVVKLLCPVINPFKRSMPAEINNLLVADSNIASERDWSGFGINRDGIIAKKGEIRLCDTRMYDFNRQGIKGNAVKKVLLAAQDAQDCANWSLLHHFGIRSEFDMEKNNIRRMVKYIMSLALPKMRAYADAMM